ncbi:MAG: MarR family transcriptional regulator [Oscillospiraceae bacterium]|nr:MarR family transcriptional regulator [Oscillospiraceae bacterium]
MEYKLNEFATDDYKMLVELSHHQIKIKGVDIVPMTQKEIADECKISYPTTNKLVSLLIEKGCLRATKTKGRYIITKKGLACIEELEKVRTIDEDVSEEKENEI